MAMEMRVGDLLLSVEEAEETLRALRAGFIDGVVVQGNAGQEVLTFRDLSHPYRLLVEAMSEGAALLGSDGIICYHNPRFSQWLGAPNGSLCGKPLTDFVNAEDKAAVDALLVQARSGPARAQVNLFHENGGNLPVQLSVSTGNLGEVPVLSVVATDMREHRRQEEMYRNARIEIEGRDRLFSIAAHELRGPLSVLELQTDRFLAALSGVAEGSPLPMQKTIGRVEILRKQCKHLAELVTKLLDLGTIGAGRVDLVMEKVDLAEVVRRTVEECAEPIRRSGSTVNLELEPVTGTWDRVRLEQIVSNIVSNAAKYGLGKPVRIIVERDGQIARLRVEDQGVGIPITDRERVFRPYERIATAKAVPGARSGVVHHRGDCQSPWRHHSRGRRAGRGLNPGGGAAFA